MYLSRLDARSSLLCTVGLLHLSKVPKMASPNPAAEPIVCQMGVSGLVPSF